jgi:hypothetical protein
VPCALPLRRRGAHRHLHPPHLPRLQELNNNLLYFTTLVVVCRISTYILDLAQQ